MGMGLCNLELQEIHAILVKSTDFVAIWLNKFLSGEFRVFRGNGHCLVKSVGLAAIGMKKILTREFRVFHGKVVIIGFGHRHENLAVN